MSPSLYKDVAMNSTVVAMDEKIIENSIDVENFKEKRIITIIIVVFLINVADLIATLIYSKLTDGLESNQIVNFLWQHIGDGGVILYKLGLTSFSLITLYFVRKHHLADKVAWLYVTIYSLLACYWVIYALTYAGKIPEDYFSFL